MKLEFLIQVQGKLIVEVDDAVGTAVLAEVGEAGTPLSPDDLPRGVQHSLNEQLINDLMSLEIEVLDLKEYSTKKKSG